MPKGQWSSARARPPTGPAGSPPGRRSPARGIDASGLRRLAQGHEGALAIAALQRYVLNVTPVATDLNALVDRFVFRGQGLETKRPVLAARAQGDLEILFQRCTVTGECRAQSVEQRAQLRIVAEAHRGTVPAANQRKLIALGGQLLRTARPRAP